KSPASDPGGRPRQSREPIELARLPLEAESPWSHRCRVHRQRRPSGPQTGDPRGFVGSGLAALLYVHFLRNALDYVPRKVDDDCLQELRWFTISTGCCERKSRRSPQTLSLSLSPHQI